MKAKHLIIILILYMSSLLGQVGYNEEFCVNEYTSDYQWHYKVLKLSEERFVICWQSMHQDGDYGGIYAKIYNYHLDVIKREFLVNTKTKGHQDYPFIFKISENNFIICWNDGSNLKYQMFDNYGNKIGSEMDVCTNKNGGQSEPTLCNLNSDKFLICWASNDKDESKYSINYQVFDTLGNKLNSENIINLNNELYLSSPIATKLSNERIVVYWRKHHDTGNLNDIYFQVFDNEMNGIGDIEKLTELYNKGSYPPPFVYSFSNNKFVVCWNEENFNNGYDINIQYFNHDGNSISDRIIINEPNEYCFGHEQIFKDEFENLIVLWKTSNNQENKKFIRLNKYNSLGNLSESKIIFDIPINLLDIKFLEENVLATWIEPKINEWGSVAKSKFFSKDFTDEGKVFSINISTTEIPVDLSVIELKDKIFYIWRNIKYLTNDYTLPDFDIYGKYFYTSPIHHDLSFFDIIDPQNDKTSYFQKPHFLWNNASNIKINLSWELTYDLYISSTKNFTNPLVYKEIEDTTFQFADTLEKGQTYYWKVLAKNWEGDSLWCNNVNGFYVSHDAQVGVDDKEVILSEFSLSQNYPNPFNPTTTIGFEIPLTTNVEIVVYSLSGKKIKTLVNSIFNSGYHNIVWDGLDNFGNKVSSGIYYYKLITDLKVISKKMILMK